MAKSNWAMNRKLNYFSKIIKIVIEMYLIKPYLVKLLLLFIKSNLSSEKKEKKTKILKILFLFSPSLTWWTIVGGGVLNTGQSLSSRVGWKGARTSKQIGFRTNIYMNYFHPFYTDIETVFFPKRWFPKIFLFYISEFYIIRMKCYRD